ncbi:hypothetical protein [Candidatus Nitrosocosmicus arcticus]|nr:hypothetical protein [Candidatus Nitrosocosmicus arcticus]
MKYKKEIRVAFEILFIFGVVLIGSQGTGDSVYGQTNSTINQTSTPTTTTTPAMTTPAQTNSTINQTSTPTTTTTTTPAMTTPAQEEASESIRGAITETGAFLSNVTEKVATSKSAGTILNETSEVLGNAYIEAKRFFSPN